MYFVISFFIGCANAVNRMINVKAGQLFGAAKGALINYLEATVLSLALIFLCADGASLLPSHIASVPAWVYLGGVCGLLAMLLTIFGTPHTNAVISSLLLLGGNLGTSLVMDYLLFDGTFRLQKVLGIFLILCGAYLIERQRQTRSDRNEETK